MLAVTVTVTVTVTVAVAPAVASAASDPTKTATATTPATKTPAPTTTTPTPAKPYPIKGSLRLYMFDAFFVSRDPVTVPDRVLHVSGLVRPYVPGQWVTVRAFLGKRLIKRDRLRVKPSRNKSYGGFSEKLSIPGTGKVNVEVAHHRNDQQVGFLARRDFTVLSPSARFGSRGPYVALIQQRLAALHFYIRQTGVYDQGTGLAIDAYHRLLRRGVSQDLDSATANLLLNGVGQFKVRHPRDGKHVEGDLTRQVLALIDKGKVLALYPISSGKPSTPTILGHFRVYLKQPGYLPDGMYYSNFFIRGYAVHGYDPAPDFPASHGCMRLPISDAISVYHWLNIGDVVDVYY
jgi:L,D-transpeptidase catalytic domain